MSCSISRCATSARGPTSLYITVMNGFNVVDISKHIGERKNFAKMPKVTKPNFPLKPPALCCARDRSSNSGLGVIRNWQIYGGPSSTKAKNFQIVGSHTLETCPLDSCVVTRRVLLLSVMSSYSTDLVISKLSNLSEAQDSITSVSQCSFPPYLASNTGYRGSLSPSRS